MARPRQVTDEQILEVARAVFLEQGPKAPVSVIAGLVGVSDATLFKRFGTKQELLLAALMPPERPEFIEIIAAGPGPGDLRIQLIAVAQAIAEALGGMLPRLSALRAAGLDHHEVIGRYDVPPPVRAQQALAAWIRVGQADGRIRASIEPDSVAMTIMGAMHFRLFMCNVVGAFAGDPDCTAHLPPPAEYGRQVIESLWTGLAPSATAPETQR